MPDALPVPREAVDAFIAEHGVTKRRPCAFKAPPTVAEMERMQREIAKLDGAGRLTKYGLGKNWRQQRAAKGKRCSGRSPGRPKGSSKLRPHYQRLIAEGATVQDIVRHFGVTVQNVYRNLARMELAIPRGGVDAA